MKKCKSICTFAAVALIVSLLYWALAMPYSRAVAAGAEVVTQLVESPDRTLDVYMEKDRNPDSESRLVVATFFDGFGLKGIKLSIYTIHCNLVLLLTLLMAGVQASLRQRMKYACGGMLVTYASHVILLVFAIEMVHMQRTPFPGSHGMAFFMARLSQIDTLLSLMVPVALWIYFKSRCLQLDGISHDRV